MKLAKSLTTVTPFSKFLAMLIFIIFPFIGFYLGILYQKYSSPNIDNSALFSPSATAIVTNGSDKLDIFIKNGISDAQISKLAHDLEATKGVNKVKVTTQKEALSIYKERYKNDPLLVESVTSDLLPASIEANVDTSSKEDVVKFAKSQAIVSSVLSN